MVSEAEWEEKKVIIESLQYYLIITIIIMNYELSIIYNIVYIRWINYYWLIIWITSINHRINISTNYNSKLNETEYSS